jgi:hypothetical protein
MELIPYDSCGLFAADGCHPWCLIPCIPLFHALQSVAVKFRLDRLYTLDAGGDRNGLFPFKVAINTAV